MSGALVHHLTHPDVRAELSEAGLPRTADALADIPDDPKYRHGLFGEILATEYIAEFEGATVPVYRLRYRSHPHHSMPGDDVLAIASDEAGNDMLLIVEAKAGQAYRKAAVVDACKQVREASAKVRPTSLTFVLNTLADRRDQSTLQRLSALYDPTADCPPDRRYLIFLVTGTRPRDPFGAVDDSTAKVKGLGLVSVHLSGLAGFVKTVMS
jgi:hypothetical protein